MSDQDKYSESQALENAWRRYAELDLAAEHASAMHKRLSAGVITLGVLATLIAVLSDNLQGPLSVNPLFSDFYAYDLLLVLLALIPLLGTAVLAFSLRMKYNERFDALRAGAEEIRKEIYTYRTILQQTKERDVWLTERVAEILRHVYELSSGDLVIEPYTGPRLPHRSDPRNPTCDSGFDDLLAQGYILYRLDDQMAWHNVKLLRFQTTRVRFMVVTYTFSLVGAILGMLGWILPGLPIWVAVTSSVAAAVSAWVELRRMDNTVQNYSKVVLELGIIRDHWMSLEGERRTGDQFFRLVTAVERVLWTQHNKYISEIRKAVADMGNATPDPVAAALASPVPAEIEEALKLENYNEAERERARIEKLKADYEKARAEAMVDGEDTLMDIEVLKGLTKKMGGEKNNGRITAATRRALRARPHAFVVMPFGRKKGFDGQWIDFNAVYQELIKPALIEAEFEPFRADESTQSGDILTDMFQELLLADLVICDLSIDNANVFYEVGIRHAFRKRGVVHIQSGRAYMPFDIFNVRTIPYNLNSSGKPDPETKLRDMAAIARVCIDTYKSEQEAVHSPVFNLLSGLSEPDRNALRTSAARGFWSEYEDWKQHMEIASRQGRIGDILLLTEEIRNPLIKEEAITQAGSALKRLEQHELAIDQYRRGQALNPGKLLFRREEAFHLNRIDRTDDAIVKLEKIIQEYPKDSEAIAALGRIYRQMWSQTWRNYKTAKRRKKAAFAAAHWLIKSANTYLEAYKVDQNQFYPGINALTWATVLTSLADEFKQSPNADIETIRDWLPQLTGAVQFSLEKEAVNTTDYWLLASLGEMYVTSARDPELVSRAYKKALTAARKDISSLRSSLGQLNQLEMLGFRPEFVKAGKIVLQEEIDRILWEGTPEGETNLPPPDSSNTTQEYIYLFSGHMLDKEGAEEEIFPAEMIQEASEKIKAIMDDWGADSNDVGVVVGAAAGGDILFMEDCLSRGMRVEILLPYDEPTYIGKYIAAISDEWVTRYYDCRNQHNVSVFIQTDHVGEVKSGDDAIERNNRWGMFTALAKGVDRMRFLALWNGNSEPGTYGAIINDMVDDVRAIGGRVVHLNTSDFDFFNRRRPGRRGASRELLLDRLESAGKENENFDPQKDMKRAQAEAIVEAVVEKVEKKRATKRGV